MPSSGPTAVAGTSATWSFPTSDEFIEEIAVGSRGDIATAGSTRDEKTGAVSMVVSERSENGVVRWSHHFHGVSGGGWTPCAREEPSLAIGPDGEVVVAAGFDGELDFGDPPLVSPGPRARSHRVVVAKFDREGKLVLRREFGDKNDTELSGLAVGPDGAIALTGCFTNSLTVGNKTLRESSAGALYLIKLTTAGEIAWAKQLGEGFKPSVVAISQDGVVFVGADVETVNFGFGPIFGPFAARFQADGTLLRDRTPAGEQPERQFFSEGNAAEKELVALVRTQPLAARPHIRRPTWDIDGAGRVVSLDRGKVALTESDGREAWSLDAQADFVAFSADGSVIISGFLGNYGSTMRASNDGRGFIAKLTPDGTWGACAGTKRCVEDGQCTAVNGKCIAATSSDCGTSDACTKSQRCRAHAGICVP